MKYQSIDSSFIQEVLIELEYGTGLVRRKASLKKILTHFKSNKSLRPRFKPTSSSLVPLKSRSYALSEFLEEDLPIEDVSLVSLNHETMQPKVSRKVGVRYENPFYKMQRIKVNFAISHGKASVVCQTPGYLKSAQNIKFDVYYDLNNIYQITVDFPVGTPVTLVGNLIAVDTFSLENLGKFFVTVGKIDPSRNMLGVAIYEFDSKTRKLLRVSYFDLLELSGMKINQLLL